jgi:rubrerythrin
MRKMTKSNLEAAFAGESQAHMKYGVFAEKARAEGYANVARLFEAISYAERVHAANHLRVLGGAGVTTDNLEAAIGGETYEVDEMYPAFGAVAELQEEKQALRSMNYALEAEKIHAALYTEAKQSVSAGKDINVGKIHICDVCGYTGYGEAPDICPVCKAKKEKFTLF